MTIYVPSVIVVFFVILSVFAILLAFIYLLMLEWNYSQKHAPQFDDLTGLCTRGTIRTHICQRLSQTNRIHHAQLTGGVIDAMMILDLDCFKNVNDTLGHPSGDYLLSCIAEVLLTNTRSTDIVGRMGGDEFLLFLSQIQSEDDVLKKADELLELISKASQEHLNCPRTTASIGIALVPQHGTTFEELYCKADAALYHAKENGKNCYAVYQELAASDLIENPK